MFLVSGLFAMMWVILDNVTAAFLNSKMPSMGMVLLHKVRSEKISVDPLSSPTSQETLHEAWPSLFTVALFLQQNIIHLGIWDLR